VYDRTGSLVMVCEGTYKFKLYNDYLFYYRPLCEKHKEHIRIKYANQSN
jgi:hypothetical protein